MKATDIIYVFNFLGDFIEKGTTKAIADKYFSGKIFMLNKTIRKDYLYRKWLYFQKTESFYLRYKKVEAQVILGKKDPYLKKEERQKKVYTPEDKWRIVNRRKTDAEFAKEFNTTITAIRSSRSGWKMKFNDF